MIQQQTLPTLWQRQPALLYGLSATLGASLALFNPIPLLIYLLALFFLSYKSRIHSFSALLILLFTYGLTLNRYHFPPRDANTPGLAQIEIISIQDSPSHLGKRWKYRATLISFTPSDMTQPIAKNIPVSFSLGEDSNGHRPMANHLYSIKAHLRELSPGYFTLSSIDQNSWKPIKALYSLTEWRYHAKKQVSNYIQRRISDANTASFLSGIATGQFQNQQLSLELNRFGLQHLMAISGLHFSILAALLGTVLWIFLPKNIAAGSLIVILTLYFLFLGNSPSVMRAWITITLLLVGILLEKSNAALNSFGIALLVVALLNPLMIGSIGFQFSFAITASILLWSSPITTFINTTLGNQSIQTLASSTVLNQHYYLVINFLRSAIALSLAVNLAALPLTLYHFGKFPFLGLLYNLFFPFLVSFSMLLLLLGLLTTPFSYLSGIFHLLNDQFTTALLKLTYNLPKSLDVELLLSPIPETALICYFIALFSAGLILKQTNENRFLTPSWMV